MSSSPLNENRHSRLSVLNGVSHITAYARQLDRQQKICITINVSSSYKDKVQTYVENMYTSEMFDDREMRGWENKNPANQTWGEEKSYFVKLYKIKDKFN